MNKQMKSDETPICIGDPGDRHPERHIEPKNVQGEWNWTCPTCGWLLKEFMGENVEDYV